jgi:hypothetical protein
MEFRQLILIIYQAFEQNGMITEIWRNLQRSELTRLSYNIRSIWTKKYTRTRYPTF